MSWYQENKFAGNLLGATAVVSGILIYLGMSANSGASAAKQREQAAVTKINTMQAAKPYPSAENEKLLADGLAEFAVDTEKFQGEMLKFRPEKLTKISVNEFSGEVSKYIKKLTDYYKAKRISKTDKATVYFGMESYSAKMAPDNATSYLNYQREALEWLFISLADSGIDSLDNIYRAPVAEELGKASKPKPVKKGRLSSAATSLTSVYDGLPIEITFTGTEASLQNFMTKVAAGNKYFFATKLVRILNREQDPVTISEATFAPVTTPEEIEEPGEGVGLDLGDSFGGGDDSVKENDAIIKQVIGDEKITVFMQLDLVLLKGASSVPIPGLEKASVKGVPKKAPTK